MSNMQINVDYVKMIGAREAKIEALRTVLQQKDERIRQLEERLDALLKEKEQSDND